MDIGAIQFLNYHWNALNSRGRSLLWILLCRQNYYMQIAYYISLFICMYVYELCGLFCVCGWICGQIMWMGLFVGKYRVYTGN